MAIEYMSFEEVLTELRIDEEELKKLVSQGELRGFRDGLSMKFKKDDVIALKQGRETEPTIILTDSDQEMGIAESSDELILEDSTSDTVINIGDIMTGQTKSEEEIVFDTTEEYQTISPHDSDPEAAIPTVEVPSVNEDMGLVETDSDAALVEVGSSESMETDQFELMEESQESEEGETVAAVATVKGRPSGSTRRSSARMRSLQIQQKDGHGGWTISLFLFGLIPALLSAGVLYNDMRGIHPEWVTGVADTLRDVVDSIYVMLN
jgi:hypothetical protein